ncbi:zinc finger protein 462-like [Neltuma alba]|uniref:zinc finger protein 462-like n=1 Tax=Neltuma alba TaxID=207710 RepID=UPI0010A3B87B|nr:zinc finger protein 462-like [Prosopis alba]
MAVSSFSQFLMLLLLLVASSLSMLSHNASAGMTMRKLAGQLPSSPPPPLPSKWIKPLPNPSSHPLAASPPPPLQ